MKALIIYDSVFGNTEQIARAIGAALVPHMQVETLRVSTVRPEQLTECQLLIVGSPTRGFRPTEGVTNFLKGLSIVALKGIKVAAFDTRFAISDIKSSFVKILVRVGGYAAKPIADRLKKKGGSLIAPPEGFFVKDIEGPLEEGELERAADWAKQLLAAT